MKKGIMHEYKIINLHNSFFTLLISFDVQKKSILTLLLQALPHALR